MQLYIKQMEYKLQFISSLSLNEWKEFHKSRQSYSRRLEIPFIFSFSIPFFRRLSFFNDTFSIA
jgi:hypothetical protein